MKNIKNWFLDCLISLSAFIVDIRWFWWIVCAVLLLTANIVIAISMIFLYLLARHIEAEWQYSEELFTESTHSLFSHSIPLQKNWISQLWYSVIALVRPEFPSRRRNKIRLMKQKDEPRSRRNFSLVLSDLLEHKRYHQGRFNNEPKSSGKYTLINYVAEED